jgi:hypothetical protein
LCAGQPLSADPGVHVLLIEAGGRDANPLIAHPDLDRPNAHCHIASLSILPPVPRARRCRSPASPARSASGFVLRPDSQGSSSITPTDPGQPLDIDANYFVTEHDRTTAVGVFRGLRGCTTPIRSRRGSSGKLMPGHDVQTDQDIIDAGLTGVAAAVTPSAPVRWDRMTMSSTRGCGSAAWRTCASWTPRCYPSWSRATSTPELLVRRHGRHGSLLGSACLGNTDHRYLKGIALLGARSSRDAEPSRRPAPARESVRVLG